MHAAALRFPILLMLVLTAPSPAFADDCAPSCRTVELECRKDCDKDAACLADCIQTAKLCPELCRAAFRGGGDPGKTEREINKVLDRHEATQKKAREQKEQQVPRNDPVEMHHH